jgi:hypothetical protein
MLLQNSSEERDLIGGSKKERFKSSFGREENSKEIKLVNWFQNARMEKNEENKLMLSKELSVLQFFSQ